MREGGQVFTFDMLLALILVMLIVTTSGLAITMARKQASEYVSRYSLERTASDADDILVRSPGEPDTWQKNPQELEVPGIAKLEKDTGEVIPNRISGPKLAQLRDMMRGSNWNPENDSIQAIMGLFGGTEKFEISIWSGDNQIAKIWPGWDEEENSGVENSLEVAVAERLALGRYGDLRYFSGRVYKSEGGEKVYPPENFEIAPNELEIYDWYLILKASDERGLPISVYINAEHPGPTPYKFNKPGENILPDEHGGMDDSLHTGTNTVQIWSRGKTRYVVQTLRRRDPGVLSAGTIPTDPRENGP
ncbi:hypothetical protein AKJ64_03590, partial [candidate division MSBL1 archaeon SCGC-AAA259E17]